MENLDILAILERMKETAKIKEDQELAIALGTSAATFSNWKKSPHNVRLINVLQFAQRHNVDYEWLFYGSEQKKESSELSTHEKMVLLAFNDLDDRQKMEALVAIGQLGKGQHPTNGITQTSGNEGINSVISGDLNIKHTT